MCEPRPPNDSAIVISKGNDPNRSRSSPYERGTMSRNDQFAGTSRENIRAMGPSSSFSSQFDSSLEGNSSLRGSIFPVRPGQPDCPFFIKTGDCKFGAMCRFHHPIEKLIHSPDCTLNPEGFPLRPGKPQCSFYSRFGTCKYGPTCKFDHPITAPMGTVTASLSTSSSEVPVVQQVSGSLSGPHALTLSYKDKLEFE